MSIASGFGMVVVRQIRPTSERASIFSPSMPIGYEGPLRRADLWPAGSPIDLTMANTPHRSAQTGESERRDYFRHDLVLPMACVREGEADPRTLTPARLNLSANGIRFSTAHFCRVGNRVDVLLGLPGGAPIRVTVLVSQLRPDDQDDTGYVVSGHFIGLPRRTQERLIQFLLRAQASHLKQTHEERSDAKG